jgi:site-specific recombinase XerD
MESPNKKHDIIIHPIGQLAELAPHLPAPIVAAGEQASRKFAEFFTANIRNPNTRQAYAQAARRFFDWCEGHRIALDKIEPMLVAVYIEEVGQSLDVPSVKQHLAAIRMLFDYLVVGQVIKMNPAAAVRGPKHVVTKGTTPVLAPEEAHELFDSIAPLTIADLRDRALIGVMVYSFARVGAVVAMNVEDYYQQGKRFWFRLHEKGGKLHDVPAHHKAEEYLDAYIAAAGIADHRGTPLFRSLNRTRHLSERRLHRLEVLAMVKRRARKARLSPDICCHSFRATGITAYLLNGGTLEHAQRIAAHSSPRTTKLYDRTRDDISLDEIERIVI